ncbi:MAG: alpha-L-rhamnosidase N-terminal domain-containing protein, partial [Chitinophagaceae bacterium]
PRWVQGFWTAHWIAEPQSSGSQFGVYQFRKNFNLDSAGQHFVIHVSADNHYRLFINGRYLGNGPARSDLANWNFETYDLAPYLHAGSNTLAVTVWNFGDFRPYSQISFQTALIVQGNTAREEVVNTNKSWKVLRDEGYRPLPIDRRQMQAYFVTAEGEELDFRQHPEKFEQPSFNDATWTFAQELWYPAKARTFGTDGNWQLVPRTIPLEEEYEQYFKKVVTPGYSSELSRLAVDGTCSLTVPAGKKISLLIDQTFLTNAYPHVVFSGGKDARITLSYAEALFDSQRNKGHRDSTAGKTLIGLSDRFIASGAAEQVYTPLYFRTFRYVQVEIEAKQEPLQLTRFYSVFTGYPFQLSGEFSADQPNLQKIWTTGWRTARLCAVDTYFDCPYYEQLQYVGDTRIQAL